MLVHFRLTVPADLSGDVQRLLLDGEWATNVTVDRGACLDPEGDLVEADIAREQAGRVLQQLGELGLDQRGGIVVSSPESTPFDLAAEIEQRAPGHPDDAVIWESVEAQAEGAAQLTLSYLVFLVLAVMLAAVAVINDSAILVVGAMVVSPEFTAIAAIAVGLVLRRWSLSGRSLRVLVLTYASAVAVAVGFALIARAVGLIEPSMLTRPRPQTDFIWHPDTWSFVVALIAGAAGAVALAVEKTSTLVGVFISVTTVPAAGNLALGIALWETSEIVGSVEQLAVNVAGMVVSGVLVLLAMRLGWDRLVGWSDRVFGRRAPERVFLARGQRDSGG